jgi:hypothetical protein
MANSTTSRRFLVTCLLLIMIVSGCDKDRSPSKLVFIEPVGKDTGQVKLILIQAGDETIISPNTLRLVTLTRYAREAQEEGASSQRWPGDTSGQYRYVEQGLWEVRLSDFPGGLIPLEPGFYQFKHNSVTGQPPSGFYGNSDYFEIKAGEEVVLVQLELNAAI